MNAEELIAQVLEDAENNLDWALYALEDGHYLTSLGLTDDDTEVVEEAHNNIKERILKTRVDTLKVYHGTPIGYAVIVYDKKNPSKFTDLSKGERLNVPYGKMNFPQFTMFVRGQIGYNKFWVVLPSGAKTWVEVEA